MVQEAGRYKFINYRNNMKNYPIATCEKSDTSPVMGKDIFGSGQAAEQFVSRIVSRVPKT